MTHIRKECRLGLTSFLRQTQRLRQRLIFGHGLAHFRIDLRKTEPDGMNHMVIAFLRTANTRHTDHFIVLMLPLLCQITVCDNGLRRQPLPDVVRVDKLQKAFPVDLRHIILRIPFDPLHIRKMYSRGRQTRIPRIISIAYAVIFIQVDIVYAAIIRCHRGDHSVCLILRADIRHVRTNPQDTEPSVGIIELELCGLELPRGPICVQNVLKIDQWLVCGKGFPVHFNKMFRRDRIKDLPVVKTCHILRTV